MRPDPFPLTRPAYAPAGLLSDLLVRDRRLLDRLVTLGLEGIDSGGSRHALLVGPPGSGKTHLLHLAAARLRRKAPKERKPLAARLPENIWSVTSFADLLLRALEALARQGEIPQEDRRERPGPATAREAAEALRKACRGRPLLLILENLDRLFAALGEEGQKEFRAFLQEEGSVSVWAGSRRLFDQVTRRTSPFYGFFRLERLEPLAPQRALTLAGRVLEKLGPRREEAAPARPETAAWIRAVHHVSRGNARLCLLFSLGLARDASFRAAFMDALDRISPIHMEEVRDASPQQRKILDHLADRGGAIQVKEIARACLASEQTVSSQLRGLLKEGLVAVTRLGRNSFYELSDPLLRICLDLDRGEGRAVLREMEFLAHWFRPEGPLDRELEGILAAGPGRGAWTAAAAARIGGAEREGSLPALGAALVRSLKPLLRSPLGPEARREWLETWKARGRAAEELALPLAWMEGALREAESPRSPLFLALPLEARELLLPLLEGA